MKRHDRGAAPAPAEGRNGSATPSPHTAALPAAVTPSPHTAALPASVECPFCGGHDSRPLAAFGSLLMTSQFYCNPCRTTFEWVRRERVDR